MKRAMIVLTVFCLAVTGSVRAAIFDGVEGYWPFEGDFKDASGNGHHGTPREAAKITFQEGLQGQCILSDGTNPNGIDCGTWNPSEATGQLSVSVWVKWNGPNGGYQGIVSKRNGWGLNDMWCIECNNAEGVVSFSRDGSWPPSGERTFTVGQWEHYVVSFDGTTVVIYLNGAEIARGNFSFGAVTDATVNIGSSDSWNGFNGAIDEVVIWNRAITAEEVGKLYNGGKGLSLLGNRWKATNISPPDGIGGVPTTGVLLEWGPPTEEEPPDVIRRYDVYFGTDAAVVGDVNDLNVPVASVAASGPLVCDPGVLQLNTVYYWRVDAVISDHEPNIAVGDVWSFDTIETPPLIVSQPVGVMAAEGSTVTYQFVTSSYSPVTYTWYKEGQAEAIGSGDTLVLEGVTAADEGFYYCRAENVGGVVESVRAGFELPKLLAHFKLDEAIDAGAVEHPVVDSGPFGHDGVEYGEVQAAEGIIGGALLFDGTGDWIDTGTWNPNVTSPELTVSVWARWNGLSGSYQSLIGKRDGWGADLMMWQLGLDITTGEMNFQREGSFVGMGGLVLPIGEWVHVAVTFDGTTARTYYNGLEISSGAFSFGSKTDAHVVIGSCGPDAQDPFNGALDDVQIYNYALDPVSIALLYTSGSGKTVCMGSPAYDFDGDCVVNLGDFALIAAEWMRCDLYPASACE
ncbi:MAG TPA: immunoglobulin domain-containing protein [Anaerohalosphaeraceae bacterium]|nr:immunoglobulin domain-containing protein [Anaerohalosphaeraceae bacterium]HRT49793.1 immunoglobulin domain-containing protein [Anaerohalosphaeraceae bacterium]HRT85547.1 immunoglobulin domain-containing protein [Anaerohalosphaeraceae bacterium]